MQPATPEQSDRLAYSRRVVDEFHPLELIRYFRRWKPGPFRDLLYTLIWNGLIGILFWGVAVTFQPQALSPAYLLGYLLAANAIGFTIHALFMIGHGLRLDRRARAAGAITSVLYYTGVSTLGVVLGFAVFSLAMQPGAVAWLLSPRWIAMMGFSSLVISVIIATIFFSRERQAQAEAELNRERVRAESVERQAALANLRALQAQIEPHFLFNTLANVASLIEPDPRRARHMLESFIHFLRASLGATRTESTTLAAEGELIAAYLDVLQVRMGPRLRYRIEVDPAVRMFAIPPMLLQPLVENAITHGLEPKVEGGEVSFRAARDGDHVCVEIADTGVGFAATTRGGVGLGNLRDRLKLIYGERAALRIRENTPAGAVVTLRIPA